jgi:hypothetical protein
MNAVTLPTILDLGRLAGVISLNTNTTANEQSKDGKAAFDLLDGLHDAMACRRAQTLGDVTAQLVVAFILLQYAYDFEGVPKEKLEHHQLMLKRIVLSALPVVAKAADVDLTELDADYLVEFGDREFMSETAPTSYEVEAEP